MLGVWKNGGGDREGTKEGCVDEWENGVREGGK